MKKLYLLRHAEPERSEEYYNDFDYPLTNRGKADARYLAERFRQASITVDMIITSSARRTVETAEAMAEGLACKENLIRLKELYLADMEEIALIVRSVDDKVNSLLVVAHNQGLTDFVDCFSDQLIGWLKPCDLVALDCPNVPWREFRSGIISAAYSSLIP